jgi:arabinose-5-phosphate isomerase
MDQERILQEARRVLNQEAEALRNTAIGLGKAYLEAVELLFKRPGKIILSGVGKSELIGRKMAATFTSTGSPAICIHATDALHGDIGIVQDGDVAILISRSGSTEELLNLLPVLQSREIPVIAMTCFADSPLARNSEVHLLLEAQEEACPHGLAPTTSTTATMALGDALAVCLLTLREFSNTDFARVHPSGSLGKKLLLRAKDLIRREPSTVRPETPMEQVILSITAGRAGATVVTDTDHKVLGIITDGDLRRLISQTGDFRSAPAATVMSAQPKTGSPDMMAAEALALMEEARISQLILADEKGKLVGLIHIHDLIAEGIRS